MTQPGNINTLRYDAGEARGSRWMRQRLAASPPVALPAAGQTRLLREQHWPSLTGQVFEEPAFVSPTGLPPLRQHRLLPLAGAIINLLQIPGIQFKRS